MTRLMIIAIFALLALNDFDFNSLDTKFVKTDQLIEFDDYVHSVKYDAEVLADKYMINLDEFDS